MVNQTEFWKIIDQARQESNNNLQEQVSLVKKRLSHLPVEDIKTFDRIYSAFHERSYNEQIWENLEKVVDFVSDDGFHYFRSWLISRGEYVFREVCQHPERVSEFVDPQQEWMLEDLNYATCGLYEHKPVENLDEALASEYQLEGYDWLSPSGTMTYLQQRKKIEEFNSLLGDTEIDL